MISDYTRAKIQVPFALGLVVLAFVLLLGGSRPFDALEAAGVETRARVSESQYVAESGAGKRYGTRTGGYSVSYYFLVDGVKHTGSWFYETGSSTGGALKGKLDGSPTYIQVRYVPDDPSLNMPTIAPSRSHDYNRTMFAKEGTELLALLALAGGWWTFYALRSVVQERAREMSRLERKRLSQAEKAQRLPDEPSKTTP